MASFTFQIAPREDDADFQTEQEDEYINGSVEENKLITAIGSDMITSGFVPIDALPTIMEVSVEHLEWNEPN